MLLLLALTVLSCGVDTSTTDTGRDVVGFVFVGERDDLGYNQAAWEGHEAVARAFPDVDVIGIENVPEDGTAVEVLEDLVDRGARVLFATSFGHLAAAYEVAERHPDVVVVHQGGLEPDPGLDNFGTYFGDHSEALYGAGITAGAATSSGRLGFVAAFPIPATFNNVNAFLLGARVLEPDAVVEVVFTGAWCDPAAQADAVRQLVGRGADVLAQHQDCTRTVLSAAEEEGLATIGYHSDGSEVAPNAWLTGAVWNWSDLFIDIVAAGLDGTFADSPYDGDFRGTLAAGDNPFALTEFGPSVDAATAEVVERALDALRAGDAHVFTGPLRDVEGAVRVPAGTSLHGADIDRMDFFLDGVVVFER